LPAGTYQVKFTLTEEQAAIYEFTKLKAGDDGAVDSNADPATGWTEEIVLDDSNSALTGDYDREFSATEGVDPTWDAGVVLKPVPTPESPDPESDDGSSLPDSGMNLNAGLIAIALALLL